MEKVIIVNPQDQPLGLMEKMEAHRCGALHRAVSVFIYNGKGQLLIQQRAAGKYHSAGLWSNACCAHPREGESNRQAAERRLREEMGIGCTLTHWFSFIYRAELNGGLVEHEYDHVFFGVSNQQPKPDPDEVSAYRYLSLEELAADIGQAPDQYTDWFKLCIERIWTISGKNGD